MAKKSKAVSASEIAKAKDKLLKCEQTMSRVGRIKELSDLLEAYSGKIVPVDARGALYVRLTNEQSEEKRMAALAEFVDKYLTSSPEAE